MKLEADHDLVRMRRFALGLLVLSACAFAVCKVLEEQFPFLSLLRAGFEGAMVGGLADWFAVTALFRHPMGIPIPHTALIPKRKNEIGKQLGQFIRANFLQADTLRMKWRQFNVLPRIEKAVGTSGFMSKWTTPLLHSIADWLDSKKESWKDLVDDIKLTNLLQGPGWGKRLHSILAENMKLERRNALVNRAIDLVDTAIDNHSDAIRAAIVSEFEKAGKPIVAGTIAQKWPELIRNIQAKLYRARFEEGFPLREKIDAVVQGFLDNPEWIQIVEDKVTELLRNKEISSRVQVEFQKLLEHLNNEVVKGIRSNTDAISNRIENTLGTLISNTLNDPSSRERIERTAEAIILRFIRRLAPNIETFIASEVEKWDGQETADLIENQVGKDLQWIRINGSLIGFLAGSGIQLGVLSVL